MKDFGETATKNMVSKGNKHKREQNIDYTR